ncbi:MAG: DsbA family protein [Acidobacteriia bacterium]|nr:DsbA family protein [Terriglobia bacterium]
MKLSAIALVAVVASLANSLDIDRGKVLGSPSAPIKIDVYSDFECPACKVFHENTLPQLMRDYVIPGKATIVSHEFPLNIHQYSREAANYATAAARIGKYQAVADALFRKQTSWGANGKVWETVANVLTAEEQKKMQALAKDPSVLAEVQTDMQSGQAAGINETPTIFVTRGSQRYPLTGYALNYNLLKKLLNDLLK